MFLISTDLSRSVPLSTFSFIDKLFILYIHEASKLKLFKKIININAIFDKEECYKVIHFILSGSQNHLMEFFEKFLWSNIC